MTEAENLLAELIWEKEPIGSGDLVKLALQRLGWKKARTYTVLRRICKDGVFQYKAAVVTSKMTREEYMGDKEEQHPEANDNDGSQPNVVPDFLKRKRPNKNEIAETVTLIEEYRE